MKLKKISALLLVGAMTVSSLAGCGTKSNDAAPSGGNVLIMDLKTVLIRWRLTLQGGKIGNHGILKYMITDRGLKKQYWKSWN